MGASMPIALSWKPSSGIATASLSAPLSRNVLAHISAPCPYPLAFTAAMSMVDDGIIFLVSSIL